MLYSLLIFNNAGKPRYTLFSKAFKDKKWDEKNVFQAVYNAVSQRSETCCNFINGNIILNDDHATIVYRSFATLYIVVIVDGNENHLAILDFIQILVETLDKHFGNVSELDVIFNFEKVSSVINEMICGGIICETDSDNVIQALE
ncbi:adaptor-related protein complex 3 sigma 1 subunit [Rozella allomycis CSF55]|uniref:AP complex subunit sigma n=1 Tax=Rozella allomycis (strain CSF55) TaxID=988480 RepID=A0A4P9YJ74_ROZAC|nr:adaptor-related protein complex 3 sigma 1 subunit [Rozella allomycis CSF55]